MCLVFHFWVKVAECLRELLTRILFARPFTHRALHGQTKPDLAMMTVDPKRLVLCALFAGLLLISGFLRLSEYQPTLLSPFSEFAMPLYFVGTIVAAVVLVNLGTDFNRMGFGFPIRFEHLMAAAVGVVLLQLSASFLSPIWESILGQSSDLERFSGLDGSLPRLLGFIVVSWTIAAFGEEFAFRIVLMGGLQAALGGGKKVALAALLIQACIFGLVHMYQGPVAIISSTISGLILGGLVLSFRGAIWPAALAHGANNTFGLVNLYLG